MTDRVQQFIGENTPDLEEAWFSWGSQLVDEQIGNAIEFHGSLYDAMYQKFETDRAIAAMVIDEVMNGVKGPDGQYLG